jgi:hypothetical protein
MPSDAVCRHPCLRGAEITEPKAKAAQVWQRAQVTGLLDKLEARAVELGVYTADREVWGAHWLEKLLHRLDDAIRAKAMLRKAAERSARYAQAGAR